MRKRCPYCKADFEQAVKAAYKLGMLDKEKQMKRTIEKLQRANQRAWNKISQTINSLRKTNHYLWNLILGLDIGQPLSPDDCSTSIVLTIQTMNQIIRALKQIKRRDKNYRYHKRLAGILQNIIIRQKGHLPYLDDIFFKNAKSSKNK